MLKHTLLSLVIALSGTAFASDNSEYNYQSTACNHYQHGAVINDLIKQIIVDCKNEFTHIDTKLKIIDSEFTISENPQYQHVIKLKLHSFNMKKGIIEYNVFITEKSICDLKYQECKTSCASGIQNFSCTNESKFQCTCG